MLLDLSADQQDYVEDCEVCCNPIRLRFSVSEEELAGFDADRAD